MDILAIFVVLFQFKYFISWFEHILKMSSSFKNSVFRSWYTVK